MEIAAGGTFAGLGLELGGKDPAYVRADANLDHAIENLADGAFFNSGQSCCGLSGFTSTAPVRRFVAGVAEIARGHVLNSLWTRRPPWARWFGRPPPRRCATKSRRPPRPAPAPGRPAGFARDDGAGAYLAPQVLIDVDHDMAVMREESFGPVVGIMPVSGDDQAAT